AAVTLHEELALNLHVERSLAIDRQLAEGEAAADLDRAEVEVLDAQLEAVQVLDGAADVALDQGADIDFQVREGALEGEVGLGLHAAGNDDREVFRVDQLPVLDGAVVPLNADAGQVERHEARQ